MTDKHADLLLGQMRGAFNRKLVLWAHLVLGMLAGMVYLSRLDLTHFRYYGRGASTAAILMAAPALLPYLISAIYAKRFDSSQRSRVYAFLGILTAGAVGEALAFLGIIYIDPEDKFLNLYCVLFLQTMCYCTAAALLLDDE